MVAIKKISNTFEQKNNALRTYRELKIQRLLEHENIVQIQHIIKPANMKEFKDVYIVMDHMESDLAQLI